MAAKNIEMSKIKSVLRLHVSTDDRGKHPSNREIAKTLSLYKGTVNEYIRRAKADELPIEELLQLDDPVLERRLCPGTAAYSDRRFDDLSKRMDYIFNEMKRPHVTLQILYEEYCKDVDNPYSYTQFCHHYNQHKKAQKAPTMVLTENREGGKEMMVDYAGDKMQIVNPETGEIIKVEVFVATLPASNYDFVLPVQSQKVEDFLLGCSKAMEFFGGVPQCIICDNLKAAVIKSDRYQPTLNRMFEDFCNYYGTVAIPARPMKPRDKALAENLVRNSYTHIYAPLRHELYTSLEELQEAVMEQLMLHNQKRMKQYKVTRQERFLAIDKPRLKELPKLPYEIKCYREYTVKTNSYIQLGQDGRYYSVPYQYIGKRVTVMFTPEWVNIYYNGELLAQHNRRLNKGRYVDVKSHLPSYYGDYQQASPERYIERGERCSPLLGKVIARLFQSNKLSPPENFYNSCDGLLHLYKTTDCTLFNKACTAAIKYDRCTYKFIKDIIKSKGVGLEKDDEDDKPLSLFHENIRGKAYYKEQYY